jgi:hypothetical protein
MPMEMGKRTGDSDHPDSIRSQPADTQEERVTWIVWKAGSHVWMAVTVLALIALLVGGIHKSLGSHFYAGLSAVILFITVLPFYLPTRYTLDEEGVQVQSILGNRYKSWLNLKVYFRDGERGILLSPVAQYGILAQTWGIYLPYRGNAATAHALVARHLAEGGAAR